MDALIPAGTANIKLSWTPSQSNWNLTLELYLLPFLLWDISCLGFNNNKKIPNQAKRQGGKTVWRDKASIRIKFRWAESLELSDKEFKITAINMLKNVKDKVGSMQEQMGNVSKKWKL